MAGYVNLATYLSQLKVVPPEPSFEPELDDKDGKKDREMREAEDLASGCVMTGRLEQGTGTASPVEGDLVFMHLSIRTKDGVLLCTTRPEEGGSSIPQAFVIGKGKRCPRGWELALEGMKQGERCVVQLKQGYGYDSQNCGYAPPKGFSSLSQTVFDIHLLRWHAKSKVKVPLEAADVIVRTVEEGTSWESPRAPFEVEVDCKARVPSSSGQQGAGAPYFSTPPHTPLCWTIGDASCPPGLEHGICSVSKGERAFISIPGQALAGDWGPAWPRAPPDVDRVELEVQLLSMLQVRDLTGTGEVTKRRVKDGRGEFPMDCPLEDNRVCLHYTARLASTDQVVLNTRGASGSGQPLEFDTGMGAACEALDMAVRLMTPGEVSIVKAAGRYAYDGRPERPQGVEDGAEIEFQMELLSYTKHAAWVAMTPDEKLTRAEALKEQGNATLKAGQLKHARTKYLKAIRILDQTFDFQGDDQVEQSSRLKAACLVNLALLCQKEESFGEALKWCEKALQEQPTNAKAVYRQAQVWALLGEHEKALQGLEHVKEMDPSAAADVDREAARLHQRHKAASQKQKQTFRNFFDR